MILVIPHYLPPMSFGGCEELSIEIASRTGGMLYCPRASGHRSRLVTGANTFRGIFEEKGISMDRVFYHEDVKKIPWEKVSLAVIVGLYWPEIVKRAISSVPSGIPIGMIPAFHVHDDGGRSHRTSRMPQSKRLEFLATFSGKEGRHLNNTGLKAPFTVFNHLAGITAHAGREKPAPAHLVHSGEEVAVPKGRGYALFPSRASKNVLTAIGVAGKLTLPLVGNRTYSLAPHGRRVLGHIDFDKYDPYKGAAVTISLGRKDSYCIGIAKSILRGVPAVWDNGNTQIREIWDPFPSALKLYDKPTVVDLDIAMGTVAEDAETLQKKIDEGWNGFLSFLGVFGFDSKG